jgi:hypothetical protein
MGSVARRAAVDQSKAFVESFEKQRESTKLDIT